MSQHYDVDMVLPHHCLSYRAGEQAYGTGLSAFEDHTEARMLLADHLTEFGEPMSKTLAPGTKVLIQTVTMYWCGEVEEEDGMFVRLKDASWVHWTGHLSVLLRTKDYTQFSDAQVAARTEYVGRVAVSKAVIAAVFDSDDWVLPTTSLPVSG